MKNSLYISGMNKFKRGSDPSSVLELGRGKPKDYTVGPWSSITQNSECETIATNIMVILGRNGNNWRILPWKEYKEERLKDGNFTNGEKELFERVESYCCSPEKAKDFAPSWKEIYHKFNKES